MQTKNTCEVCYKIICKECGWEANEQEVVLIQQEKMIACPVCGWQPKNDRQ